MSLKLQKILFTIVFIALMLSAIAIFMVNNNAQNVNQELIKLQYIDSVKRNREKEILDSINLIKLQIDEQLKSIQKQKIKSIQNTKRIEKIYNNIDISDRPDF